jgi:hypothetical protein
MRDIRMNLSAGARRNAGVAVVLGGRLHLATFRVNQTIGCSRTMVIAGLGCVSRVPLAIITVRKEAWTKHLILAHTGEGQRSSTCRMLGLDQL